MLCLCSPSLLSCLSFWALPTSPGTSLFSSGSFFSPFSSIQFLISFAFFFLSLFFFLLNNASVFKGWEKLEKWFCEVSPFTELCAQTSLCRHWYVLAPLREGRKFGKVPIGQDIPVVTDKEPQILQLGEIQQGPETVPFLTCLGWGRGQR